MRRAVCVCASIHERIARAVFTLSGVSAQFRFYNGSVFVRLSAQVSPPPPPKWRERWGQYEGAEAHKVKVLVTCTLL